MREQIRYSSEEEHISLKFLNGTAWLFDAAGSFCFQGESPEAFPSPGLVTTYPFSHSATVDNTSAFVYTSSLIFPVCDNPGEPYEQLKTSFAVSATGAPIQLEEKFYEGWFDEETGEVRFDFVYSNAFSFKTFHSHAHFEQGIFEPPAFCFTQSKPHLMDVMTDSSPLMDSLPLPSRLKRYTRTGISMV